MASLERWKLFWFVILTVFCANFASELRYKEEKTINVGSPNSKSESCALLNQAELAQFTKQVTETCIQSKLTVLTPATTAKYFDVFCQVLQNLTSTLCALENENAEIFVGVFKNLDLSDGRVCTNIEELKSDDRTPLIDSVKSALLLPRDAKFSQRTVSCETLCNGTTQILCNFALVASRILSTTHDSFSVATNVDNQTNSTKNISIENTGIQSGAQSAITVAAQAVAGLSVTPVNKTSQSVSGLTVPDLINGATDTLGQSGGPSTTAKSALTANAIVPGKPTKVTVVAGSARTSQSPTGVTRLDTTVVQGGQSVPSSVVASSKPSSVATHTSTTSRPMPAAGRPAPIETFDDFQNVGSEDVKDVEMVPVTVPFAAPEDALDDDDAGQNANIPVPQEDDGEYEDPVPPEKGVAANGIDINNLSPNNVPKKHGTFSIAYPDGSGSGFLPVFFMFVILSISLYFVYHYRSKIMGLLLEGRSEKRRRPNTSQYRRLNNKLEDVLPVDAELGTAKRMTNVIY